MENEREPISEVCGSGQGLLGACTARKRNVCWISDSFLTLENRQLFPHVIESSLRFPPYLLVIPQVSLGRGGNIILEEVRIHSHS